ncbi:MAG: hypothetical protein HYZ17_13335 [Betaproteobacteria bacterium]|nr:hypothetical protein [Betaproteobacteria bacterium]
MKPAPRCNVTILAPSDAKFALAFAEVAQTYALALRELGCPCLLTTNQLRADALNIVFGINQFADYGAIKLPDNAVIVNLEQYYLESPWFTPSILDLMRKHPVWDYNQDNVASLQALGVSRARMVPIGSALGMQRIRPVSPDIDVLHYGWLSPRRQEVLARMAATGLRVKVLDRCFGAERDAYIARAKTVLQVRAEIGYRVFEIVRASYLMTNGVAVISEWDDGTVIEPDIAQGVLLAAYDDLPHAARLLCADAGARAALADRGREIMAARPQRAYLAEALRELLPA